MKPADRFHPSFLNMGYITLAELKQHIGLTGSVDDAYLTVLIGAATDIIDSQCGRHFEPRVDTRGYGEAAIYKQRLWLNGDLQDAVTITNGDGAVLQSTDYRLWPYRSGTFGWAARAVDLVGELHWVAKTPIIVFGNWGFSPVPPPAIMQATTELAADLYYSEQRRDAALIKGAESFKLARDLPPRVWGLIAPFVRRTT